MRLEDKNKTLTLKCAELYIQVINYKKSIELIQKMINSAWKQNKYIDGGLYNDLTEEFNKINEVNK